MHVKGLAGVLRLRRYNAPPRRGNCRVPCRGRHLYVASALCGAQTHYVLPSTKKLYMVFYICCLDCCCTYRMIRTAVQTADSRSTSKPETGLIFEEANSRTEQNSSSVCCQQMKKPKFIGEIRRNTCTNYCCCNTSTALTSTAVSLYPQRRLCG